jgi:hypothetical protein
MPRWINPPLRVYHGTSTDSISGSVRGSALAPGPIPFAISLSFCRPYTDFGHGFYVTTSLHQAREWANSKVRSAPHATSAQALVLEFFPDRDQLASLETLCFVRPTKDYWDLIHDCRNRFPPHQRVYPYGPYDVVYGPVTIWPSRLLIANCDQISFHTQRALICLGTSANILQIAPRTAKLFP